MGKSIDYSIDMGNFNTMPDKYPGRGVKGTPQGWIMDHGTPEISSEASWKRWYGEEYLGKEKSKWDSFKRNLYINRKKKTNRQGLFENMKWEY